MTRMCKHMVLVVIFATTFWARHAFLTRINPEIRIRIPDHFWLMLDGAVLAPSQDVCPSVRPSVLRRCSVEPAKHVLNGSVLAPFTGMGKRTGMTELEREGMGMLHVLLETSHLIGYVK